MYNSDPQLGLAVALKDLRELLSSYRSIASMTRTGRYTVNDLTVITSSVDLIFEERILDIIALLKELCYEEFSEFHFENNCQLKSVSDDLLDEDMSSLRSKLIKSVDKLDFEISGIIQDFSIQNGYEEL